MPREIHLNSKPLRPTHCPVCGAEIPRGALACPGCGADEKTGWDHRDIQYGALNLPDEEFDYEDWKKREFGAEIRPRGVSWLWWVTGIVLLALFVWLNLPR
jgi:predicted nucleic acid-binding Zn ribbon protein